MISKRPAFADLLDLAVTQPRRYGAADPDVLARLFRLLRELAWSAEPDQRAAVDEQLGRLRDTAAGQDSTPNRPAGSPTSATPSAQPWPGDGRQGRSISAIVALGEGEQTGGHLGEIVPDDLPSRADRAGDLPRSADERRLAAGGQRAGDVPGVRGTASEIRSGTGFVRSTSLLVVPAQMVGDGPGIGGRPTHGLTARSIA